MSGNVHPNLCLVFPSSVCAGNVTWRGWLLQCCTRFKWIHLRCSLLSSRFKTRGSSHSRSCPPCCDSAFSAGPTPTNTVSCCLGSSSLYTSTVQPGPSGSSMPMQRYHPTLVYSHPTFLPPLHISTLPTPQASGCSPIPSASSSSTDPLRVLQWNGGGIRATSAENYSTLSRLIQ